MTCFLTMSYLRSVIHLCLTQEYTETEQFSLFYIIHCSLFSPLVKQKEKKKTPPIFISFFLFPLLHLPNLFFLTCCNSLCILAFLILSHHALRLKCFLFFSEMFFTFRSSRVGFLFLYFPRILWKLLCI